MYFLKWCVAIFIGLCVVIFPLGVSYLYAVHIRQTVPEKTVGVLDAGLIASCICFAIFTIILLTSLGDSISCDMAVIRVEKVAKAKKILDSIKNS